MTPTTLLLRQVNPNWVREGRITSQVFRPTPKDKGQLSVYDGDQMTPQQAYTHYTRTLMLNSVGVMAVTVAECQQQELPVVPDPASFAEHVLVDFRAFLQLGHKDKGQALGAGNTLPRLAI